MNLIYSSVLSFTGYKQADHQSIHISYIIYGQTRILNWWQTVHAHFFPFLFNVIYSFLFQENPLSAVMKLKCIIHCVMYFFSLSDNSKYAVQKASKDVCSKCHTLKSSSRTVSVQVLPVRYEYQPRHDPHGYNPVNYQRHYHWARSC